MRWLAGFLDRYIEERVQLAMRLREIEREAQLRHLCGLPASARFGGRDGPVEEVGRLKVDA
jgi:hypothetical protein